MSDPIQCLLLDHGFHNYTMGPCCHTSNFAVRSYQELHEHPVYIEIKQVMSQGQWHAECGECANIESKQTDGTPASKRQMMASRYLDLQQQTGDRDLTFLCYDVGRLCNLACRSCSPLHSSSWVKEWNHIHSHSKHYDSSPSPIDLSAQSFRDIRSLDLLGGEPLYMPETYEIMRRAIEETGNQCMITINSNGTIFPDLDRYPWFQNNPMIIITFSIDAIGPAAEFIRTGTNWTRVENNIRRYLDIGVGVGYHVTHSLLNLFELDAIENWREQLGLPICKILTVVSNQPKLTFQVLTELEKQRICAYLQDRHGRFLIPYIQASVYDPALRHDFLDFMEHTKAYHGLDWREALPDLWQLMHAT